MLNELQQFIYHSWKFLGCYHRNVTLMLSDMKFLSVVCNTELSDEVVVRPSSSSSNFLPNPAVPAFTEFPGTLFEPWFSETSSPIFLKEGVICAFKREFSLCEAGIILSISQASWAQGFVGTILVCGQTFKYCKTEMHAWHFYRNFYIQRILTHIVSSHPILKILEVIVIRKI